jgi:hypothetical protein
MAEWTLNVAHKKQTKLFDCWYACIQMLISFREGTKTKPVGAAQIHRDVKLIGRKLGPSETMDQIKEEHGLVDLSGRISRKDALQDAKEMNRLLKEYGPIMISGQFGGLKIPFMNRIVVRTANHFIVLAGTDDVQNRLWIHDPIADGPKWMSCERCHDLSHVRLGAQDTALACDNT